VTLAPGAHLGHFTLWQVSTRFLIYEPVGDSSDARITVVLNSFSDYAR